MTFDLDRAVKEGCRTRDGRPVRIICTDVQHAVPIVAVVTPEDDADEVLRYSRDGLCCSDGRMGHDEGSNLVNLPKIHEVTVQIWAHKNGIQYAVTVDQDRCRIDPLPHDRNPIDWTAWGKPVTVRIEKGE